MEGIGDKGKRTGVKSNQGVISQHTVINKGCLALLLDISVMKKHKDINITICNRLD